MKILSLLFLLFLSSCKTQETSGRIIRKDISIITTDIKTYNLYYVRAVVTNLVLVSEQTFSNLNVGDFQKFEGEIIKDLD